MSVGLFQKKWFAHVVIWLSYFFLLVWLYSDVLGFFGAFKRSFLITVLHVGVFYLNLQVLLPYVLEKKMGLFYYLIVINIVLMVVFLFRFVDDLFFFSDIRSKIFFKGYEDLPFELKENIANWRKNNPARPNQKIINIRSLTHGFTVVMILLISTLYRNRVVKKEKEAEASVLKNQMLEAESKILKWQINPHFLFNTLNNIYALTQMKSDRAPDAIHRLSEMLRYVIYDCNEKFVSLKHELNYIKGYIALQLLKDDKISNVHYKFHDIDVKLKIAPMLLIPFIENSFKHSKIEDLQNGWIDIKLKTVGNQLQLMVNNSIPEIEPAKDNQGGIGLENVKRRLELTYTNKYDLTINRTISEYSIKLSVNL